MASLSVVVLSVLYLCSFALAHNCTCNGASPIPVQNLPNPVLQVARVAHTILPGGTPALPHALALVMGAMYLSGGANDSAGYAILRALVSTNNEKLNALEIEMNRLGISLPNDAASIASTIASKYSISPPRESPYMPPNPPSTRPGIAQCNSIVDPDGWQPLCIPSPSGGPCVTQMNGMTRLSEAPLISLDGRPYRPIFTKGLKIPVNKKKLSKLFKGTSEFADQYRRALKIMYPLNDWKKTVAEVFSPPAFLQILSLVIDDLALRKTDAAQSARTLFITMGATRDAIVAVATYKTNLAKIRPITVLQCGLVRTRKTIWKGPYHGMGKNILLSFKTRYTPYLTTPSSASYPSGHTAAVTAATTAYMMATNTNRPLSSNCIIREPGSSMIEGKIEEGQPGYMKGITDVPNKGSFTKGFVPAKKVTICWQNWKHYATLVSKSRLFGGIHTPIENNVAKVVGRRAAQNMIKYIRQMK